MQIYIHYTNLCKLRNFMQITQFYANFAKLCTQIEVWGIPIMSFQILSESLRSWYKNIASEFNLLWNKTITITNNIQYFTFNRTFSERANDLFHRISITSALHRAVTLTPWVNLFYHDSKQCEITSNILPSTEESISEQTTCSIVTQSQALSTEQLLWHHEWIYFIMIENNV